MNFINIIKLQNEDDKYELFIDRKRACRGNLAAIVATINANLLYFSKKYNMTLVTFVFKSLYSS